MPTLTARRYGIMLEACQTRIGVLGRYKPFYYLDLEKMRAALDESHVCWVAMESRYMLKTATRAGALPPKEKSVTNVPKKVS